MLVPIRIGSGLRTKTLAAFAQGVPVVSTSVGAEGLKASDGVELIQYTRLRCRIHCREH
jgi:hypothetical protein